MQSLQLLGETRDPAGRRSLGSFMIGILIKGCACFSKFIGCFDFGVHVVDLERISGCKSEPKPTSRFCGSFLTLKIAGVLERFKITRELKLD